MRRLEGEDTRTPAAGSGPHADGTDADDTDADGADADGERTTGPADPSGDPRAAQEPDARDARRPGGLRRELGAVAVTLVATALLLVPVLRLTDVNLSAPLSYAQDGVSHMMIAKSVQENPWYYENPRLGAPEGQQMYDYPQADTLHIALFKVLGPVVGDNPARIVNAAYLLGFLAAAATTYAVLRQLRVRPPLAVAGALLYAFTPYHLVRGTTHLFLSGYFLLPLALLVVVRQLGDHPALTRPADDGGGRLRFSLREGRTLFALTGCLLITTTGIYYAVFVGLLLGVVLLVQLVRRVDARAVISTVVLLGVIGAGLVGALFPALAHQAAEGPNPAAVNRAYIEVEFFALKPVLLLLPVVDHRLEVLRGPAATVNGGAFPGEPSMQLGVVAALGVVGAVLVMLGRAAAPATGSPAPATGAPDGAADPPRAAGGPGGGGIRALEARLGALAVAAILLATSAGFGALLGVFGFTQIRAWARMTIVIAFFGVAAAVVAIDRFLARRALPPGALWGVAAVLAVGGVMDQSGAVDLARLDAIEATWDSDAAFVGAMEQQLGRGAGVFQLPYVPFPENPPVEAMIDYDHLKGFLHSDTLRWSYAGMKGRDPAWKEQVAAAPAPEMLADVVSAGFTGLYIDRFGYADRAAGLEAQVSAELGVAPQVSRDGRLVFYDLTALAGQTLGALSPVERAARRAAVTDPVEVTYGPGFHQLETDGTSTYHWAEQEAVLQLGGDTAAARPVTVTATLRTAADATVSVRGAGVDQTLQVGPSDSAVTFDVSVPTSGATLRLQTDGPPVEAPADPRALYLRVADVVVAGR